MTIKNKQELINQIKLGKDFNYLGFFGGLNSTKFNSEILSNFYPCEIPINTKSGLLKFNCSEQLFMWCKAKQFKDENVAREILKLNYNPKRAKSLGRQVSPYDDNVWNNAREDVMYFTIKMKFMNGDKKFRDYLLSTGDAVLVEASPYDKIWGCGIGLNGNYSNPSVWTGENKLGFLLMKLRDELRKDDK